MKINKNVRGGDGFKEIDYKRNYEAKTVIRKCIYCYVENSCI